MPLRILPINPPILSVPLTTDVAEDNSILPTSSQPTKPPTLLPPHTAFDAEQLVAEPLLYPISPPDTQGDGSLGHTRGRFSCTQGDGSLVLTTG